MVLFLSLVLLPCSACSQGEKPLPPGGAGRKIRPPAVAGGFYPGSSQELSRMVDELLGEAQKLSLSGRIVALIAPHAGYVYSGKTAAWSFKQLQGSQVNRVLLIGCSHRSYYPGVSIYGGDGYRTPLGVVPVDQKIAAWIRNQDNRFNYYPSAHAQEHSLEVELPFLQRVLKDFEVVPILLGQVDRDTVQNLGRVLGEAMRKESDSIIVCSTDMTHYPSYEAANRIDRETLEAIESMDPEKVIEVREKYISGDVPNLSCTMCGENAVLATMEAARVLGVDRVKILDYSNSGDASFGNKNQVVGYGAVVFLKEGKMPEETNEGGALNSEARKRLLEIAHQALEAVVNGQPLPQEKIDDPDLQGHQGAFVTITKQGRLRGCIGQFIAQEPLYRVVRDMAHSAALKDPRFPPVTPAELKDISIEISVLSPLRRISDPLKEVELGKHGIYIKKGWHSGTYLPQVATDHNMSLEEFLTSCTAHKAGLPADAWKDPDTEVYVYTAQVFGEK